MLVLSSHGLFCRERDSFTRTSLLHQIHLAVLSPDNGVETEQRQTSPVSEGKHGLYGLFPASPSQDVSAFTHSVTNGCCVLCSSGFACGFSGRRKLEFPHGRTHRMDSC